MRDRTHYSTNTLTTDRGEDWRDRARCAGDDPELWFPNPGQDDVAELAKATCRRCPVAHHCLAWAVTTGQEFGIWGGLSERERRRVRRDGLPAVARAVAPVPTTAPLHGRPWSAAELEQLERLANCRLDTNSIARAMDRSERSVRTALHRLRHKEGARA